jgi:hypothetical protein
VRRLVNAKKIAGFGAIRDRGLAVLAQRVQALGHDAVVGRAVG